MIPIQCGHRTIERYVQNIVNVYHEATREQHTEGVEWYLSAHFMAEDIADGDIRVGAGLLAALSPQTSWWLNVELASDAFESGNATRHVADACSKANRIMAGEDPESVLPMLRKTGQFYRCIVDPSDSKAVCVDRHAHDVAVGEVYGSRSRGLSAGGRYALISHCYRLAAKRLAVLPMVVQAVTWVAWREGVAGTSTQGVSSITQREYF